MAEQNNNASSTEEVRLPPVNMRKFRIMSIWFVRFFFVLLFSCFILSLIIPLRPKYSESEKRELAKFPKFTFTALVSGKYFDGINSWYSDTFPLREKLTDINAFFTGLYGKSDVRIQGDVETGDDRGGSIGKIVFQPTRLTCNKTTQKRHKKGTKTT